MIKVNVAVKVSGFVRDTQALGVSFMVLTTLAAAAFALRAFLRKPPGPAEVERDRRSTINAFGKLGDGEIVDVVENSFLYSYSVGGVRYTSTQDISGLEALLPPDRVKLIGPVLLKYLARNPANSIIFCEEWSGLRSQDANSTSGASER